jgi:2-polyprenyl-3-methyl-5-hydroxy-6-metoxy-1,4-benzoquinol methylase
MSTSAKREEMAPPNVYEFSACPVCGESLGTPIHEETCEGVRIELVECARCRLVYSNPRPTEAYKIKRYANWAGNERPWQAEAHYDHRQQLRHFGLYKKVMQVIQRKLSSGRILDVGCGGGLFLIFAGVFSSEDNAGIRSAYQVEGAGFDPAEVELSKRISGAPIHSLAELRALDDNRYDAVTLLNVLEHVNRPLELLCELRRLLRHGGMLVVVVPNNKMSFLKLRWGRGQQLYSASEHINHFRPEDLKTLLRRSGFSTLELHPPLSSGGYGSIIATPAKQLLKHAALRGLDALTQRRMYLYSEIMITAE